MAGDDVVFFSCLLTFGADGMAVTLTVFNTDLISLNQDIVIQIFAINQNFVDSLAKMN